jgi:hypothetical protein
VTVKNLPASVHARLQSRARETQRPFQELLQYFAMERFLYRLSKSPYRSRFLLKGALMLHVWDAPLARATKDIDLLGSLDKLVENLARVVREVCTTDVEPDGMVFEDDTVKAEQKTAHDDYDAFHDDCESRATSEGDKLLVGERLLRAAESARAPTPSRRARAIG